MNASLRSVQPDAGAAVVRLNQVNVAKGPARTPRRRRRRHERESDLALHNHATDRWMVSYADFITLLFAFFVVMYAMSSVNEGRYRVLSGVLSTAFSAHDGKQDPTVVARTPEPPIEPAIVPPVASVAPVEPVAPVAKPVEPEAPIDPVERAELQRNAARAQRMQMLASDLDTKLQSLSKDGQVKVTRGARGIAIEINAAVLFDPARAELKSAAFDALKSVADVLNGFVEPLQVEGHSDDIPIATREFRSNWELSAARAASVARFLIDQGVDPARVGIAGYAEFRPLVGNSGPESRARNRRVTLVVLSADDSKPKEGPAAEAAKVDDAAR